MSSAPDEKLIFKLLGPIEVIGAEEQVQVPPGRQQTILGALGLTPSRTEGDERATSGAPGSRACR